MLVNKSYFLSIMVFCALTICITSSSVSGQDSPPTIQGMVIDEEGKPMPETNITIMKFGTTEILHQTSTSPRGFFDIYDLPLVYEYQILVEPNSLSGYPLQYWGQEINTNNPPTMDPIKLEMNFIFSVLIGLTQTPSDISVSVNNYFGAFSGQLSTENGLPFPGVKVVATTVSDLIPVAETETDSGGNFILWHVPADHPHFLQFIPNNSLYPEQFLSHDNSTTKNPDFSLEVFPYDTWMTGEVCLSLNPDTVIDTTYDASIKITLLDSTNTTIQSYGEIILYNDMGNTESRHIDPNTQMPVEFHHLPPGNYSIFCKVDEYPSQFFNPDGNTVADFYNFYLSENETRNFDIYMTMHPQDSNAVANFSGIVTNTIGEPIENAKVVVHYVDNMMWNPWFSIPDIWSGYWAHTDTDGNFEIYNVHPGEYVVFAYKENENYIPAFYPNTSNFKEAKIIKIQNYNDNYQLEFKLEKGSSISGWVKNADTNEGIGKMKVNVCNCMSDNAMDYSFQHETKSDENGFFILKGLPNGKWHTGTWDEGQTYYQVGGNEEDINITYPQDFQLANDILMRAGGNLYGTFTLPDVPFVDHWNLGRLFIYPEDVTTVNDSINDEFEHMYISIRKEDESSNTYRTDVIPTGNWRMAVSPQAWIDHDSVNINQNYLPFLKWKFIDNALTPQSTQPVSITPHEEKKMDITFETGGFILFGTIQGEKNENFGFNSVTNTWERGYNIRVYIKDSDELLQVAESNDLRDNRFYIPGLISGQEYYLEAWADGYPDQWWLTSKITPDDTLTTSIKENAKPFTFNANSTFEPLVVYVIEDPQGDDPWNEERPSYVKNFNLKPAGLSGFAMSWSASPDSEKVVGYEIARLEDAREEMFFLNTKYNSWDIVPVVDKDSLEDAIVSFKVTETHFIDTTAKPFMNYMYVVFAINDKGEEGHALPPGYIPLNIYFSKITSSSFNNTTLLTPNVWQMVGVCGLDSLTATTSTGVLEMYSWDESADSSKLYSYYTPTTRLKPTRGAWIYSSTGIPLTMTENAFKSLVTNKQSVTVALNQGWNQISSPFPYDVSPQWLSQEFTAWEWIAGENRYKEALTIKPWKAYWVKSDSIQSLPISPAPVAAKRRAVSRLSRNAGWELTVSLTGKRSSDPDNFIGTLPKELQKTIPNTSAEPPQAFDFPHLYFVKGTVKLAKQYAYSAIIPKGKIEWKVGISPAEESMNVVISDLSTLPEEVAVFWIDNARSINLRKNNSVAIEPHAETQYGYIIATANPADIALYTGKFMLRRNYPNPFSRSTTIEYTVPYIWDADGSKAEGERRKISLSVYNVSGQLVATIISGYAKVGHHRKGWNGKSNSGRNLPSGMYLARLTGGSFAKSIRMFKVK